MSNQMQWRASILLVAGLFSLCAEPLAIAESRAGTLLVVVTGEDTVAIVDPDHPTDVQKIRTRKHPQDVVLSPDGNFAYIAEMGTEQDPGSTVAVLDVRSRSVVRRLDLRPATLPHLLVLSDDGRTLWAACAPQSVIAEVDAQSGAVRRLWDTKQRGSYLLAVPRDESKLYVANFDAGTVTIIPRSGSAAKILSIGGQPIGIDVSPDGREVWVSNFKTDTIAIINTISDDVIQQIPAGGKGPARVKFTADGKRVYVTMSFSNELVGFDAITRGVIQRIQTGKFSKGLTVLPDRKRAFVSAMDEGRIADVDLLDGWVSQWIPVGSVPEAAVWIANNSHQVPVQCSNTEPAWSPDGSKIAFMSDRDEDIEIYVMNADGTNQKRLTNSPGRDAHPSWSPDGSQIVFQTPRADPQPQIYVMNADGSHQTVLTHNAGFSGVPVWSPDGSKILFQVNENPTLDPSHWQIYVMGEDGSHQRNISNNSANDQVPRWSPDGSRIIFYSDISGRDQIYVMNSDGSHRVPITNDAFHNHGASWSHDGQKISFVSDRDGGLNIYTMDSDGSHVAQLTHNSPGLGMPVWSPDDTKILFTQSVGEAQDVYVMNADGSGQRSVGGGCK